MTTDTTERGLERLICTALTGYPCTPSAENDEVAEYPPAYDSSGWSPGSPRHYDPEYCVDHHELNAFLYVTQPEIHEALGLNVDGPSRRKFLARLQGEISKRGSIDVLRPGIKHGPGV